MRPVLVALAIGVSVTTNLNWVYMLGTVVIVPAQHTRWLVNVPMPSVYMTCMVMFGNGWRTITMIATTGHPKMENLG